MIKSVPGNLKAMLLILLFVGSAAQIYAQAGTAVLITVRNFVQISTDTFTYDVFVTNVGTTSLAIRGYSWGLNHTPGLANGGTISHTFISRDPSLVTIPAISAGYTASSNHIRGTTVNATAGNEVALTPGVPVRLATMAVSTTATSWAPNFNPWLPVAPFQPIQVTTAAGRTQCITTMIVTPPGTSYAVNGVGNSPTTGSLQALTANLITGCSPFAPFLLNATCTNQCTSSNITACDSYTWLSNSTTYTTSGVYVSTNLISGGPCVQTDSLFLTVNQSTINAPTSVTACDSYTWPLNSQTYTASGTYQASFTNVAGCDSSYLLNLTVNNSTTNTSTITACNAYTWLVNNQTYTNSGTYTSTSLNANGCLQTDVLNLTINTSTSSTTTASSTTGSYTWAVNNVTYSSSGTYTATLTNASNCDSILTLQLTITGAPFTMTLQEDLPISCAGNNDAAILVTMNPVGTYTFTLNGGGATTTGYFNNLAPGIYTVCATDGSFNVCDTISFVSPSPLTLTLAVDSAVSCLGNDGQLSAQVNGGTPQALGYNMYWYNTAAPTVLLNPGNFDLTVSNLIPGTYSVVAEDDNGCFLSDTIVLGLVPALTLNASAGSIACFGGSTAINTSSSGGTGTIVYTVNGGAILPSYVAGTYTVTASDQKGCTSISVLNITEPSQLTGNQSASSCNSFTWPINNATYTSTGVYTHTLAATNGCDSIITLNLTINNSSNNSNTIITACDSYVWPLNGLTYTTSGNYAQSYTNAAGCDSSYQLNLTINTGINTTSTVTANNIYTWVVSGQTYTSSGVYTYTSQNANGCINTQVLNLTINVVAFSLSLVVDQDISCFGNNDGSIQATATGTGPFVYILDGGAAVNSTGYFSGLAPGTHTVCALAGLSIACDTISLVQPDPLAATFTIDSVVSCLGNDGMMTINITGGTNILQGYLTWWTNAAGDTLNDIFTNNFALYLDSLTVGAYTVTVEDDRGCFLTVTGNMPAAPPIVPSATFNPIICFGGTTSIIPSGTGGVPYAPLTYTINGLPPASNYGPGTYTIVATDAKGCTGSSSITITAPSAPLSGTQTEVQCNTYTWPANGTTYTNSGTYTATVLAGNGCDSVVTLNLTINTSSNNPPVNVTVCDTYTWPLTTQTYTSSGTYIANFQNVNNCDSSITLILTINTSSQNSPVVINACESYTWLINGQTYTNSGTYSASFLNVNGCDSSAFLNLTINPLPTVIATAVPPTVCTNNLVTLNASGASTYTWTPTIVPGVPFVITNTSTYTVTGTDLNGCSSSSVVTVTVASGSNDIVNTTPGNASSVAGSQCDTEVHPDGSTLNYTDNTCRLIATIADPSGGNVLGNVTACAIVTPAVPVYNTQPYLPRYFTINGSAGPATITFYFTQDDFTDYNASSGAFPQIPVPAVPTTGSTTSLCISQVPQTVLPGAPGALTTVHQVTAIWNAAANRWEVTVAVNGFGGFYFHACNPNLIPLPATITRFTGFKGQGRDILEWTTSSEQNNAYFVLEYGTNGVDFAPLSQVNSKAFGGNSSTQLDYRSENLNPVIGHNYYRLQQVDLDGHRTYASQIVDLIWSEDGHSVVLYPNPATDVLHIDLFSLEARRTVVKIMDMSGRTVKQIQALTSAGMNHLTIGLDELANGLYTVQISENNVVTFVEKVRKSH